MSANTVCHHGITFDHEAIESFCLKNGIKKLSLFGSVLRDDFGPDSDIDVLVEFMPEERVGFFRLYDIMEELSSMFGGRKIDLRTPGDINKSLQAKVFNEAEVQFER
ncbi:MAG: nucleotidyltransferase family protein [Candidatus Latescibacteria bacterium]|nr:nucleotidyltransferase family protein [Candidatus Latescibacterota bacterium]